MWQNPFTIEVWVKPAAPDVPIVGKYNTNVRGEYKLYIDKALRVVFYRAGDKASTKPGLVAVDSWNHIAARYDGSHISIVVNGEEDESVRVPSGECVPDVTTIVHVGTWKRADKLGKFFVGSIRELRWRLQLFFNFDCFVSHNSFVLIRYYQVLGCGPEQCRDRSCNARRDECGRGAAAIPRRLLADERGRREAHIRYEHGDLEPWVSRIIRGQLRMGALAAGRA